MSTPFPGFPYRGRFTPLPDAFFSSLLAQIDSLNELKVVLHIFWVLYRKRGYVKHVTRQELCADKTLMQGLSGPASPDEALAQALQRAAERGVLLHALTGEGAGSEDVYLINSPGSRKQLEEMRQRGPEAAGPALRLEPYRPAVKPDIFHLYEQNVGLLTPLIAEQLKEAEGLYPAEWVEDAFRAAVDANKCSWRYISRILERWSAEGKDVGEPGRRHQDTNPQKYISGKYGHIIKR